MKLKEYVKDYARDLGKTILVTAVIAGPPMLGKYMRYGTCVPNQEDITQYNASRSIENIVTVE